MSGVAFSGDPFDALGDPHRRAIVELLAEGPRSVGEIADELPISRPAVSRHLRLLKEAGLVADNPVGTRRLYRLDALGVETVRAYLERVWGEAIARFRLVAENTAPDAAAQQEKQQVIEPLRLSFTVACPMEHAFAIWTSRTALWWPTSHTVSGERGLEVRFEPRVGGRVFERTVSGREVDWGEVTAWEPPQRLAYLWHIMTDRASATDVEVNFSPLPDGTTQVEIVQSGWERLGDAGPGWRDANRGGWSGMLPLYVEACAKFADANA